MLDKIIDGLFMRLAPDGVPDMGGFDAGDGQDETEIITLGPGEEAPADEPEENDNVVLSREEFAKLQKGTDSTSALLEGLKGLEKTLQGPGKQEPINLEQKAGETDEQFETRLEKELWAEGKSATAIKDAIQRYGSGTKVNQLMGVISHQNKEIIKLHPQKGKMFEKYEGEIDEFVKKLPADQQNHPQVWDYALQQVKAVHADDIQSETVAELVAKQVAEQLEALGIDPVKAGNGKERQPMYMEGGRSGAKPTSGKGKKVFVTSEDKRKADESGVPVEQYLRKIGKIR